MQRRWIDGNTDSKITTYSRLADIVVMYIVWDGPATLIPKVFPLTPSVKTRLALSAWRCRKTMECLSHSTDLEECYVIDTLCHTSGSNGQWLL